jgi:hypothetical protein
MKQVSQESIVLVGSNGRKLQCQSAYGSHFGYNSRYELIVQGITKHPLFVDDFERSTVIIITTEANTYHLHGWLLSLKHQILPAGEHQFKLTIGCSLHQLDNESGQAIYRDMTVETIIQNLLAPYEIEAEYDFEGLNHPLTYTAQAGTSDYHFLIRFCITYGIIFFFHQDEDDAKLYFTNKSQKRATYHLTFNPRNGLAESTGFAHNLHYSQFCLQASVYLRGSKEDDPHTVFSHKTKNLTSIQGNGKLKLSHTLVTDSQKECVKQAELIQQQLDWQREWVKLDVAGKILTTGGVVHIEGYPNQQLGRPFQVIEQRFSIDKSPSKNTHGLHVTIF